VKPFRV